MLLILDPSILGDPEEKPQLITVLFVCKAIETGMILLIMDIKKNTFI